MMQGERDMACKHPGNVEKETLAGSIAQMKLGGETEAWERRERHCGLEYKMLVWYSRCLMSRCFVNCFEIYS